MTTKTEGAGGDLAADLAALRQDVGRMADTMRELVQHQAQAARERVSEAVGDARDKLSGTVTDAHERANLAGRELAARVGHHPLTAVLLAFAVGMSLSMLRRTTS